MILPGARKVLTDNPESANRAGYQLAPAEVQTQAQGQSDEAGRIHKHVLLTWLRSRLRRRQRDRAFDGAGIESSLTATLSCAGLGDAYYNAGHHCRGFGATSCAGSEEWRRRCSEQLDLLLPLPRVILSSSGSHRQEAEALAATNDENGARRLYLLMELARDRDDLTAQTTYVETMRANFPHSPWLAEALFSSVQYGHAA